MEIRVVLKTGVISYSFNCPNEFYATIRRYQNDPDVKMMVSL